MSLSKDFGFAATTGIIRNFADGTSINLGKSFHDAVSNSPAPEAGVFSSIKPSILGGPV